MNIKHSILVLDSFRMKRLFITLNDNKNMVEEGGG